MIPTQHIGIHYATIRNVRQWPTIPLERHSQQMSRNYQGYREPKTLVTPHKLRKQRTRMGCM